MGWADVEALKRSISADQFDQWCRYYGRYPFDSESAQIQMAILISMIANMFRDERLPKLKYKHFLPFRNRDEAEADDAEIEDEGDPEWLRTGKGW